MDDVPPVKQTVEKQKNILLVMYEGRIVEEGIPDEVIFHPQSDDTKLRIDSIL